ncbi:MAG: ATP-dependent helicase [Saprospiraceae bacterium]|nr:ATP-dependent helicase [Saprospiraceae bacterium]
MINSRDFDKAYHNLNDQQKKAVDHIEGPLLVLAGPGTGKTELLAIRVGRILQETDAKPHNILCLTFTDAGAYAMRSRLLKYIGHSAYQVGIYTYHSFCNQVIQENLEYFGDYRELQLVSDLEKVDIMRALIEGLPYDHPLKRLRGDIYFDMKNLLDLFENMKKEYWTEEDFKAGLKEQEELLREHKDYIYTRKYTDRKTGKVYQAGDLKEKKFQVEMEKYKKTYAASQLLKVYNQSMEKMERFDYQDMILWVIDRFKNNDELLGKYQERFQYLLLDEYQDTNGAQNEVVFQLVDYWDQPNLFAVGDDDQSIYRFQGANMSNIQEFRDKFQAPVIVLENNYRSDQSILDIAKNVIENNKERMVYNDSELTKDLVESRSNPDRPVTGPVIKRYRNPDQEEVGVIQHINELVKSGVNHRDIAVIYKEHKNVEQMVHFLSDRGVPLNIKRKVDVLTLPAIKQLLNILYYINGELKLPFSEERRLFQLLHLNCLNINPVDIALISIYTSRRTDDESDDINWREALGNKDVLESLNITDIDSILKAGLTIDSWMKSAINDTLQVLVEKIMTTSGWLYEILRGSDKKWQLQVMTTFLNFVKDQSAKNESYQLSDLLADIDKMETHSIAIPVQQTIGTEEGINFVTAHSSKGLEFKHVFLIKLQQKTWVKKNINRGYKYPDILVPTTEKSDVEDDRRLFYVALTRAEDEVQLSFSDFDKEDKAIEGAEFIYECGLEVPESPQQVDDGKVMEYLASQLKMTEGKTSFIDHELLNDLLKDFKHSATSLNKYLDCPLTFYFENILRVPMARTDRMGYGNAIHYALEFYFRKVDEVLPDGPLPLADELLALYEKGLQKYHSHFTLLEYENHQIHGRQSLQDYYDEYHKHWLAPDGYKLEHVVDDVSHQGIPIKGKLDKLVIWKDQVEVVDYKTGKYQAPDLKPPLGTDDLGGKYWRQLVFYKMLIDADKKHNYRFGKGTMDFTEKKNDKYTVKSLPISDLDIQLVTEQLKQAHEGIHAHQFPGCGDEKCKWCNFVNDISPLSSPLSDADEEKTDIL